jgi:hypothetical protein
MPAAGLVELLGDPHRSVHAYTRLLTLGPAAAEAARHGLSSPDARVREQCCKVLDHLMDTDSIPLLIEALADPAAAVRKKASWYAPGGAIYRRTKPCVRLWRRVFPGYGGGLDRAANRLGPRRSGRPDGPHAALLLRAVRPGPAASAVPPGGVVVHALAGPARFAAPAVQ